MTGPGGNPADLAPVPITILFVVLVVAMGALVVTGVRAASRRAGWSSRAGAITALAIAGWLVVTATAAGAGLLADFRSLPPRFLLVFVPPLVALVALGRSRTILPLLAATPPSWLVHAQSFRIVVELVLWRLIVAGAVPEIMTFTGRNVDIVVGVTAPIVAYACFTRAAWPRGVALWWNVAGIMILVNTVLHAQAAAPTPLQVFVTEPPNTFIVSVPYVWLPAFLVPLAWGLHVLSIRQLRRLPTGRRP